MNLTVEQCKPGVEIICINSTYRGKNVPTHFYSEWLKVGHVYSIREFFYSKNPKSPGAPAVRLNEITGRIRSDGSELGFNIWRFKLLDKKDIQIFYDILKQPVGKKILETA